MNRNKNCAYRYRAVDLENGKVIRQLDGMLWTSYTEAEKDMNRAVLLDDGERYYTVETIKIGK